MNRCLPAAARGPRAATLLALASLALLFGLLVAAPAPSDTLPPAPAPASSTDPLALDKKIIEDAKHGSELMANLTYLSDTIGSRLTGSAALKKANEWAADKMRSYGLTDVHLEGWTMPVAWERGTASMRVVEPQVGMPMTVAAMGWTPGTEGKITGDVVILEAKNTKDLAAYKGKLRGAIVLQGKPQEMRPINDNGFFGSNRTRDGSGSRDQGAKPEAKSESRANPGPATKLDAGTESKTNPAPAPAAKTDAKAEGKTNPAPSTKADGKPAEKADTKTNPAKAGEGQPPMMERVFMQMMAFRRELRDFLHNEGAAVVLMDSDKPHGLLNMTGSWRGNDRVSAADPLPTLFVVHEHYSQLYRLATRPGGGRTRVEVEIHNTMTPGPIAVYNTVGDIRGTEKPDEYAVLGAHIDSWDLGQGTTDNGTGTCVVLEAARILGKLGVRPKRTIRFILFSGEEQGLFGSRAYVKQHEAEMPKTSMALVHDTGTGKVQGIGLQGRPKVKPILEAALVSLKELGCTDINLRSMPGSDHMSFESAGVPGFAVQQDWVEYRFTHHSQSDTLDKAKEPDLIQGAQVLAVAAFRVANLPELLPHEKPPRKSMFDMLDGPKADAKTPAEKASRGQPVAQPAGKK